MEARKTLRISWSSICFVVGTGPKVFDIVIKTVTITVIDNKFSRVDSSVHVIDDSVGPIELTVELHTAVTIAADAHDRTNFAIAASCSFDTGQARGALWVDLIACLKVGQGWHCGVVDHIGSSCGWLGVSQ